MVLSIQPFSRIPPPVLGGSIDPPKLKTGPPTWRGPLPPSANTCGTLGGAKEVSGAFGAWPDRLPPERQQWEAPQGAAGGGGGMCQSLRTQAPNAPKATRQNDYSFGPSAVHCSCRPSKRPSYPRSRRGLPSLPPLQSRGQNQKWPINGQGGYITPAASGIPSASKQGAKSEVAHKWARWLHHPSRLGDPLRFKAGGKIRSGP